jgi:hypothetical protein
LEDSPPNMSHASHHGPAEASGGHEEHHFDGIPADQPSPDEPRTPGWLTLLGVGLVLSVLLALALRGPEEKTRAELAAGAQSAAPSAAPAAAAPNPEQARPMRPAPAAGNPPGLPSGFPRLGMSGFRPMPRPPGAAAPGAAPMRPPPAPPTARPKAPAP